MASRNHLSSPAVIYIGLLLNAVLHSDVLIKELVDKAFIFIVSLWMLTLLCSLWWFVFSLMWDVLPGIFDLPKSWAWTWRTSMICCWPRDGPPDTSGHSRMCPASVLFILYVGWWFQWSIGCTQLDLFCKVPVVCCYFPGHPPYSGTSFVCGCFIFLRLQIFADLQLVDLTSLW